MATEIAWAVANVSLTFVLVGHAGLIGTGIAFAVSYVLHGVVVYSIVHKRYGFRMERNTLLAAALFLCAIAAVLAGFELLPEPAATIFAVVVTIGISIASLRALVTMIPRERIPGIIVRCMSFVGLLKVD